MGTHWARCQEQDPASLKDVSITHTSGQKRTYVSQGAIPQFPQLPGAEQKKGAGTGSRVPAGQCGPSNRGLVDGHAAQGACSEHSVPPPPTPAAQGHGRLFPYPEPSMGNSTAIPGAARWSFNRDLPSVEGCRLLLRTRGPVPGPAQAGGRGEGSDPQALGPHLQPLSPQASGSAPTSRQRCCGHRDVPEESALQSTPAASPTPGACRALLLSKHTLLPSSGMPLDKNTHRRRSPGPDCLWALSCQAAG